ncbi:hypothetical protein CVS40_10773 [Lucilia cuprina]|nr:hypothetical protein CVS40_10773 [Lucilia cuprina]
MLQYPSAAVARTFSQFGTKFTTWAVKIPAITTSALLRAYNEVIIEDIENHRFGRSLKQTPQVDQCRSTPRTVVPTRTIVQKFPDLLQQVVFEVCESSECMWLEVNVLKLMCLIYFWYTLGRVT